jgi:hypothetical protein
MVTLKRLSVVLGLLFALMLGFATPAAKAATLPTCTPGVNWLQFGDFNVYSLPLLDLQGGGDGVPGPGDPFFFSATYGQIKNYTIVGINNGNCTNVGNPTGAADCAYNTPSNTSTNIFSTKTAEAGGVIDPGPNPPGPATFAPEFAGDTTDTWDIQTTALNTLIGGAGNPVTAFFAFNEDNSSGTGLDGASLLTWVKVTLSNTMSGASVDFYLCAGPACQGNEPTTASIPASSVDQAGALPWVYVHSGICTVGTNFVGFPDALREQNNLGQNAAAFMVNSPALDAALATGNYDVMQVLWKMAHISGGGETAWIQPSDQPSIIAEPSSLANFAVALLALGFLVRRRVK